MASCLDHFLFFEHFSAYGTVTSSCETTFCTGCFHCCQISGVQHNTLSCRQVIFHDSSVKLHKGNTMAGKLLHNETFATKETGTQFLLDMYT